MNKYVKGFYIYASVFTLLTVISSILKFAQGIRSDANLHILARAVVTFIPIFMYFVLNLNKKCSLSQLIIKVAIHYIFSLGAVFLTVFLLGFEDTLSKNAYRDIFFNFSIMYIIVAIIFIMVLTHRERQRRK